MGLNTGESFPCPITVCIHKISPQLLIEKVVDVRVVLIQKEKSINDIPKVKPEKLQYRNIAKAKKEKKQTDGTEKQKKEKKHNNAFGKVNEEEQPCVIILKNTDKQKKEK